MYMCTYLRRRMQLLQAATGCSNNKSMYITAVIHVLNCIAYPIYMCTYLRRRILYERWFSDVHGHFSSFTNYNSWGRLKFWRRQSLCSCSKLKCELLFIFLLLLSSWLLCLVIKIIIKLDTIIYNHIILMVLPGLPLKPSFFSLSSAQHCHY